MAKTSIILANCPNCGIERSIRADRAHRWCRQCSYIKIGAKHKGKTLSDEQKESLSIAMKNMYANMTKEEKDNHIKRLNKQNIKGRKYCSLNRLPESENKRKQDYLERRRFRSTRDLVLRRDNYTCVICNTRGGNLSVDHIKSWSEHPELRFEPTNCQTLCVRCHYKKTFGRECPEDMINKWGKNLYKNATT